MKLGLKVILLIVSLVLFACGCVILAMGIWAVVDKIYIAVIIGVGLFRAGAYLMVIIGGLLMVISLLGALGTFREKRGLVIFFVIVLMILFLLLLSTAIIGRLFQDEIEANVEKRMEDSLINQYGFDEAYNWNNEAVTWAWDKAQRDLECCGVKDEGWFIYRRTKWFQKVNWKSNLVFGTLYNSANLGNQGDIKYVPISCCTWSDYTDTYINVENCQSYKFGPPHHMEQTAARNDALHYLGCYDAGRRFIVNQSTLMLALGICFCLVLIVGIVIGIMYIRHLGLK